MKVLYIVTAFPRDDSDVITPWLLQTIHRLRSRGVEVEVLAPSYRGLGAQTFQGIRVHRFRYAPRRWETLTHDQTAPDRIRERPIYAVLLPGYLFAGSLAAAGLARRGGFSIVHAFWPLPHGLLGLAAKRAAGTPLVSTFFGVELTWAERGLRAARPILRGIVRRSDAVTAISSHTAELVRRLDPQAEPVIIPFGAAVEPKELRPRRGDDAVPRFLFVGRLVERKGVQVLLEAFAKLRANHELASLDILGDGPERERLQERARTLGIHDRVVFHGFVSQDSLEAKLGECTALVLPAVVDAKGDVEGLGVVLLEAMSFGRPVIGSAAGGIVDIVRPGVNGLLVPPGDADALSKAMAQLARNPGEARRLGDAARHDVRSRFSWDSIIDSLVNLYRGLVIER